jgi:hypothetical protein
VGVGMWNWIHTRYCTEGMQFFGLDNGVHHNRNVPASRVGSLSISRLKGGIQQNKDRNRKLCASSRSQMFWTC